MSSPLTQILDTPLLPPSLCTLWTMIVDFFITKQTSLHPFDFVRNLFHLLYNGIVGGNDNYLVIVYVICI